MTTKRNMPEILIKAGEPFAVLINLSDYEEMLRRLGDSEGLAMLARVRSKPQEGKSP